MSDGIFHRSRRPFETRTRDERSRELGATESRTPDQGAAERGDPGADALLELARLIGQPDSIAPTPAHANEGRANEARNPGGRLADVGRLADGGRGSPDRGAEDLFVRPQTRYPAQPQDRSYEVRLHEPRLFEGRSVEDHSSDEGVHDRRADNFDFLELSGRDEYPVAPGQGRAGDRDYDRGDHHEDLRMGQREPAFGEHDEYADEYGEDTHGHDDDYETEGEHLDDDESGVKRRSTTKVVIAVLGLAVFGSAAAFGYRTVFSPAPSGPTPIIRADNSPTKVIPAGIDANQAQVGDRPSDTSRERLVRRDEDPVDLGASYRSPPSSDVATAPPPDMAGSSPPATVPASGGSAASSDTRRVRTVTIRSDQGTAPPDRPAVASRPAPAPAPAPAPTPPRQVAALPPPTTSAPPPVATAPVIPPAHATEAGGFVVQISAQRSETDAQTAFRTMQSKYAVLNGHELIIKRKDQGDRGIFYAAQVGPFGAKSEADQLCETLKSAGGTCFVQKN